MLSLQTAERHQGRNGFIRQMLPVCGAYVCPHRPRRRVCLYNLCPNSACCDDRSGNVDQQCRRDTPVACLRDREHAESKHATPELLVRDGGEARDQRQARDLLSSEEPNVPSKGEKTGADTSLPEIVILDLAASGKALALLVRARPLCRLVWSGSARIVTAWSPLIYSMSCAAVLSTSRFPTCSALSLYLGWFDETGIKVR